MKKKMVKEIKEAERKEIKNITGTGEQTLGSGIHLAGKHMQI
jgi:hypothetical protein